VWHLVLSKYEVQAQISNGREQPEFEEIGPVGEELRKHDNILLEGIYFMGNLARETSDGLHDYLSNVSGKQLCVVLITMNRKIRYIDASLKRLLHGIEPLKLRKTTDIHLLNVERRPDEVDYPHLYAELAQLEFLSIHNHSESYSDGLEDADFPRDFCKALSICLEASNEFCLVMQDDSLPTPKLFEKLEAHVFPEMRKREIPLVWLWSPRDDFLQPDDVEGTNLGDYNLTEVRHGSETWRPVANVFSKVGAKDFVEYMGKTLAQKALSMEDYFNEFLGSRTHWEVQPSLIKHFGFYPELALGYMPGKSLISLDLRLRLEPLA